MRTEESDQFVDCERFAFLRLTVVQAEAVEWVVLQVVLPLRRGEFEQAADPFQVLVDRPDAIGSWLSAMISRMVLPLYAGILFMFFGSNCSVARYVRAWSSSMSAIGRSPMISMHSL